jgi:hypothetical protein
MTTEKKKIVIKLKEKFIDESPIRSQNIPPIEEECQFGGNMRKLCDNETCQCCFSRSFASNSKSVNWSDKNIFHPREVFKFSNKKYWLDCDKCIHDFEILLSDVSRGHWCPYCDHKKLCGSDKCQICLSNSFASHPKAKYWSDKNKETPQTVFKSSGLKYWFKCDQCRHLFEIMLSHVSKGQWCYYCGHRKLCDNDKCQMCLSNSFASHPKAQYWLDKNKKTPRTVFKSSGLKYWFKCDQCCHSFEIMLSNVSNGSWCSYCCHQKLCDDDNCQICFNNSFASHPKAKYWSDKNKKIPRTVFKSSNYKYLFECDRCTNSFEVTLGNVYGGTWCPFCHLKTEASLYEYLVQRYPITQRQFCPSWCINSKTGHNLPFDFVIDQFHLIIELDGDQHFDQISNWESPKNTQINDKYKMYCAWNSGYSVIRLLQSEVLNDQINLDKELLPLIQQYEHPSLYCIYNSDKEKHNIYCLFYEEYMLNPSIEPYTSDSKTDEAE